MQVDYQPFIDRMIDKYEGGYCWDKGDPGGPTKYGITCYDLAEHRGQRMTSMSFWAPLVKEMKREEAEDIYRAKYATKVAFDSLPAGVDCTVLDYGVNSGYARVARVCAALCGLKATTTITPELASAIKAKNPKQFINDLCDERLRFMHQIRGGAAWQTFGGGWGKRVADLRAYSAHLSDARPASEAPVAPDLSKTSTPKAINTASPTSDKANAGGAVAAASAAGVAHASGVPILWIAAGLVTLVVAFVAYEVYKQYAANAANKVVHV